MTQPYPLPVTGGWQQVDWLDAYYQSPPAPVGSGMATLTLPQLDPNVRWQLTHMVVGCTSSATTQLRLYLDNPQNSALRDGSNSGNFDVADWPQGLWIPPGRTLVAVWNGASDGAVGVLTVQANIYRLSGT